MAEPWGTLLETKGGFEFYQNSAIDFINQYPTTLAVVREDYYQKHKSAIDDFIQKQDQIFGDLKNNPELSLQAFQKHMKIIAHKDLKMDFLRTSYSRINFDSKLDEKLLLELEQELYRAKYIRF